MPGSKTLKELAARKRLLVLESEMTRQALRLEMLEFRSSLDRLGEAVHAGRRVLNILLVALPIATLVASRKRAGLRLLLRGGVSAWNFFQRWNHRRKSSGRGNGHHHPVRRSLFSWARAR